MKTSLGSLLLIKIMSSFFVCGFSNSRQFQLRQLIWTGGAGDQPPLGSSLCSPQYPCPTASNSRPQCHQHLAKADNVQQLPSQQLRKHPYPLRLAFSTSSLLLEKPKGSPHSKCHTRGYELDHAYCYYATLAVMFCCHPPKLHTPKNQLKLY